MSSSSSAQLISSILATLAIWSQVQCSSADSYYIDDYQEVNNSNYQVFEPPSYLKLGDLCNPADDNCGENAQCKKVLFCPGEEPICQCAQGYVLDAVANKCLKLVGLGKPCKNRPVECEPVHSYCDAEGVCACRSKYKKGPFGDCVQQWQNLYYGQSCRASYQCFYNLTCEDYVCSCPIGTRVDPYSNVICLPNGLNNNCQTNRDCYRKNSACVYGKCSCEENYTRAPLRFGDIDEPVTDVCVRNDVKTKKVGEKCSIAYPFPDGVCHPRFVCSTQCGDSPVCVNPTNNESGREWTTPVVTTWKPHVAKFGDWCTEDIHCPTPGNYLKCHLSWGACQASAPLGNGICGCSDGFYKNDTFTCSRKPKLAGLGERCKFYHNDDVVGNCKTPDSICSNGRCICKHGWKPGPKGDDCVINWKTQFFGERCQDAVQCHYNLACVNATCSCLGVGRPMRPLGTGNVVECKPVNAGDKCWSNSDCTGLTNSRCSRESRRCECMPGYEATTLHLRVSSDVTIWCLPSSSVISLPQKPFRFRNLNEECNFLQPAQDGHLAGRRISARVATLACSSNLYCRKCDGKSSRAICFQRDRSDIYAEQGYSTGATSDFTSTNSPTKTTAQKNRTTTERSGTIAITTEDFQIMEEFTTDYPTMKTVKRYRDTTFDPDDIAFVPFTRATIISSAETLTPDFSIAVALAVSLFHF